MSERSGEIVHKAATLSDCGLYRYSLHRWWGESTSTSSRLTFVMLNPSTANAYDDDPTIRRCMGFARTFGFDGIRVFNLYAFRATKPDDLWRCDPDPTGGYRNDDLLREVGLMAKHQLVLAAWGANAKPGRVAQVRAFPGWEYVQCLGTTKDGAPRHPLYLRADTMPQPFGSMTYPPGTAGHAMTTFACTECERTVRTDWEAVTCTSDAPTCDPCHDLYGHADLAEGDARG